MYDYKRPDRGKEALLALTLKQHEGGDVQRPARGSKKMEQKSGK